jgi:hypothetical protein
MRPSIDGERELTDDDLGFGRLEQCIQMAHEVVSSASSVIEETTQLMGPGMHEQEFFLVDSDYGGILITIVPKDGFLGQKSVRMLLRSPYCHLKDQLQLPNP